MFHSIFGNTFCTIDCNISVTCFCRQSTQDGGHSPDIPCTIPESTIRQAERTPSMGGSSSIGSSSGYGSFSSLYTLSSTGSSGYGSSSTLHTDTSSISDGSEFPYSETEGGSGEAVMHQIEEERGRISRITAINEDIDEDRER